MDFMTAFFVALGGLILLGVLLLVCLALFSHPGSHPKRSGKKKPGGTE